MLTIGTLRLNGNILSGRIPNHYGGLTKLVEVRLGPNIYDGFPDAGLTGGIPQSLGDLVDLGKRYYTNIYYCFNGLY